MGKLEGGTQSFSLTDDSGSDPPFLERNQYQMTYKVTWDTSDNERDSMCLDEVRELLEQEKDEDRLLDRFLEVIRKAVPPKSDDLIYVPGDVEEEDVADWISDEYGWLVAGCEKQDEASPDLLAQV